MKLIIDIPYEAYYTFKCDLEKGNLNALAKIVANGKPYEESSQGESIRLEEGLKKARRGNYVIYDVDFLLDNLAREVNIMESARRWKGGAE